jgi:hypothetical protein
MRKSMFLLGAVAGLAACGQFADNARSNATANAAQAEKPKPAYCFFTDDHTKGWKLSADKSGNVIVSGKGYADDARYKAVFGPPTVSGNTAEIAPTLTPNDTGYASRDNWWDMKATIPDSAAVMTVTVKCGEKTRATLQVPRKG